MYGQACRLARRRHEERHEDEEMERVCGAKHFGLLYREMEVGYEESGGRYVE